MSRTLTERLVCAVTFLEDAGWSVHSWRSEDEGTWNKLPERPGESSLDLLVMPPELSGLLLDSPTAMAIAEDAAGFRPDCVCDYVIPFPAVEDLGLVLWRKDAPCQSGCKTCEHACEHADDGEEGPVSPANGSVN